MLVFVASALAAAPSNWPCQRMNWGWRNVWTTCSINSYAFAAPDVAGQPATGFRSANNENAARQPTQMLAATGVFTPGGSGSPTVPTNAMPQFLCTNAAATGVAGTGSANQRNRCRRAIDAYAGLVKSCNLAPNVAGNRGATAITGAPIATDAPHFSNVGGLTVNAQLCTLPMGPRGPVHLNSPSTTCPGLLGWFTVVFNACNFNRAPGLSPSVMPNADAAPYVNSYFPAGNHATPEVHGIAAIAPFDATITAPGHGVGTFCAPYTTPNTPQGTLWNQAGPNFRTSRCRKALDQFGRTAQRCHASPFGVSSGPAQAFGFSDPLRLLAVGAGATGGTGFNGPVTPNGMNAWTPLCN